jgi:molybdopterin-containing oxidoreductase family iron-sulfur binding subunit
MNRRTFLKIAGMGSISIAAGCSPESPKYLYSLVHATDDMVTGQATWYASTCRECPAGCGVLAKNREGRIVKLEGNPQHPVNSGRLCMRGQAALQAVYHPDRLTTPLLKTKEGWQPIPFAKARAIFSEKASQAAGKGSNHVRMLTEVVGKSLMGLFTEAMAQWQSPPPLVFEPFGYESLKTANREIFGIEGLVSYRMDQADVLLSFGAEFLETWLSPVEYARKFKAMHALSQGQKGLFFCVSPYQSLTGANADHWLACKPGSEAIVALGLVRQALDINLGAQLPYRFRKELSDATAAFTQERVLADTGIELALYEKLITRLVGARKPLVLGAATESNDRNGLVTQMAANLLNLLLDPELRLIDSRNRHRVETAASRSEVLELLAALKDNQNGLLIINNANPVFALPPAAGAAEALEATDAFVVSISHFLDETAALADLIIPTRMALETWDDYSGWQSIVSTLQPTMGRLTEAPHLGDVILEAAFTDNRPAENYKAYLVAQLTSRWGISNEKQWADTLQKGGQFDPQPDTENVKHRLQRLPEALKQAPGRQADEAMFIAAPSIRYFDGRGANRPWLSEIPDPISRIAWQTPVLMHPDTAASNGIAQGDVVAIESGSGKLEAGAWLTEIVAAGTLVMGIGQGHSGYGRFAKGEGINPLTILPAEVDADTGGISGSAAVKLSATGRTLKLARMYGSRTQQGRTFALSVTMEQLKTGGRPKKDGLTMQDFPLTLPLPEGYDPKRDFYPPHEHDTYRWGMVVDLDRCIGCNACSAACYAENNIGIVGEKRIIEGREMTWLGVERFFDDNDPKRVVFLPLMCQHCDNAPCESVCPVYAPHHSKEGLNNQIYNRCIGTRYCVQNCPYKVRRFNWFTWQWPRPMNLQLNPDVTVRSKGVMEKCSFCIQRIKEVRSVARNENRQIRDGEVIPACVQTCPTDALVFGNLMDKNSRVRQMVDDPRAYQVLGYLNTKTAVIYLKKIRHEV